MGWKTLKERYNIKHIVSSRPKGLCIGSAYIHDLITVNPKTGKLRLSESFSSKLKDQYPDLLSASPEDILDALNSKDTFSSNLVVYSYDDSGVTEHLCEEYGYPNLTHDGYLMYENTFTSDKSEAIRWAISDAQAGVDLFSKQVEREEEALIKLKSDLQFQRDRLESLKAQNPKLQQES